MKVFFSYSHKDEDIRDLLETHLASLTRNGSIDTWHDRRIGPGDEFAKSIDQNLEDSDIILLLVSPHFIASNYCYELEMKRAMERHASGEAKVVPVIVEHCLWHNAPFGKLNALPRDGKPVTKYPNPHEALSEIAEAINGMVESAGKTIVKHFSELPNESASSSFIDSEIRSSNLHIKRSFSEKSKHDFIDNTFEYIAIFFEGSADELEKRNAEVETKFKRIDANRFETKIFIGGKLMSTCAIFLSEGSSNQQIHYSGDVTSTNSWNEGLSVVEDDTVLMLKAGMGALYGCDSGKLSQQGAAEYFWRMIMEPLQR